MFYVYTWSHLFGQKETFLLVGKCKNSADYSHRVVAFCFFFDSIVFGLDGLMCAQENKNDQSLERAFIIQLKLWIERFGVPSAAKLADAEDKLQNVREQFITACEESEQLEEECVNLASKCEEYETELQRLTALEQELKQSKLELHRKEEELNEMRKQQEQSDKMIKYNRSDLKSARAETARFRDENEALKLRNQALSNEVEKLKNGDKVDYEFDMKVMEDQIVSLKRETALALDQANQMEKECADLDERCSELQQENKEMKEQLYIMRLEKTSGLRVDESAKSTNNKNGSNSKAVGAAAGAYGAGMMQKRKERTLEKSEKSGYDSGNDGKGSGSASNSKSNSRSSSLRNVLKKKRSSTGSDKNATAAWEKEKDDVSNKATETKAVGWYSWVFFFSCFVFASHVLFSCALAIELECVWDTSMKFLFSFLRCLGC